ncbi:IPT/TIG domain-containing protein [Asanoa sp. WMMD1127]|uniref:IPT/TIG domain-containing protein n=1 Tax=Asanoa sp. WMMD1127 TaxID=3016107 RepID=UPI002415991B|nr:IPT/TIG domain-containing protein [Asanoa sp. WMMD1127]MDG4824998.1 IPT/TIG domain-containing protein [Asanoa sp. WMMD1127]
MPVVVVAAVVLVLTLSTVGYTVFVAENQPVDTGGGQALPPLQESPTVDSSTMSNRGGPAATQPPEPDDEEHATSAPRKEPKPEGSVLIRWLRKFTPAGGGDLDLSYVYAAFMQRDCADVLFVAQKTAEEGFVPLEEPYRTLYEGAGAACLAGLDGVSEMWDVAMARFPEVDVNALDCWNQQVYTVFQALVEAHRAGQRAVFRSDATLPGNCPELTGLDPDHGPRSGGYTVLVHGRNLPEFLPLYWWDANQEVIAERQPDGTMTVVVPPAAEETESGKDGVVKISGAPRIDAPLYANFRYDD